MIVARVVIRAATALLLSTSAAAAATVEMNVNVAGCTGYVSGTGSCVAPAGTVEVTWSLASAAPLNAYQLQVGWDPSELVLSDATQLMPDTGTPEPWTQEPSDPNGSVASVFTLDLASTTSLFRLTFELQPSGSTEEVDLWWLPVDEGLLPETLVNTGGAAISFEVPGVPAVSSWRLGLLAILFAVAGTVWMGARRPAPEP